jgi:hypothetical protein
VSSRIRTIDPIRSPGGASSANIGAEIRSLRSVSPPTGPFSRGVVCEVIGDPSRLNDQEILFFSQNLSGGSDVLLRAPRNSIIVQSISGPGSSISAERILCYSFFPPHFCMPIKPGEQCWFMMENPGSPSSHGYWICRVAEPDFVDDINFTHSDRRFELYVDKGLPQTSANFLGDSEGEQRNPYDGLKDPGKIPGPPSFNNGPLDDEDSDPTLPQPAGQPNPFDKIAIDSLSIKSFRFEAVPRYTKRIGDLVIQGSNNALICLGQDRGWNKEKRPDTAQHSNSYSDVNSSGLPINPVPSYCGTIDIVAGRGRFYKDETLNSDSQEIKDTQPRVILNSRNAFEIDKNSASYTKDPIRSSIASNRSDRPQEGDPDLISDASRIYVSMKTNGDKNFGISPEFIIAPFLGDLPSVSDSPFIILKSDEIRIIARKDTERGNVNGSIRIIKEGETNNDSASIYLMPSGTVQISGSKIYLGIPESGQGPGEKGSEPYVKYSELEKLLQQTYDNIDQFCQKLLTHTTPGYGSPSLQINQGAVELQTQIAQRKQEIERIKSTRVFGE